MTNFSELYKDSSKNPHSQHVYFTSWKHQWFLTLAVLQIKMMFKAGGWIGKGENIRTNLLEMMLCWSARSGVFLFLIFFYQGVIFTSPKYDVDMLLKYHLRWQTLTA